MFSVKKNWNGLMEVLEVPTGVSFLSDIATRKRWTFQLFMPVNVRDETHPVTEYTAISIRQNGELNRCLRRKTLPCVVQHVFPSLMRKSDYFVEQTVTGCWSNLIFINLMANFRALLHSSFPIIHKVDNVVI